MSPVVNNYQTCELMFVQPFITAERCELNCLYVVNIFLIYNVNITSFPT